MIFFVSTMTLAFISGIAIIGTHDNYFDRDSNSRLVVLVIGFNFNLDVIFFVSTMTIAFISGDNKH